MVLKRKIAKTEKLPKKIWSALCLAQKKAYSSYSQYPVGALLVTVSGRIILGSNIENAMYSAGICAERCAIHTAVALGETKFKTLYVLTNSIISTPPCGFCLQVISEFCDGDFEIILVNPKKKVLRYRLDDLLPIRFTKRHLKDTKA